MTTWTCRLRRATSRSIDPGDRTVLLVGGAAVAVAVIGFLTVATEVGPDVWVPAIVLLGLLVISVPLCLLASGRPLDPRLRRILLAALLLKLLFAFPRYLMNEVAFDGASDAGGYHAAGVVFEGNVHAGSWSLEGSEVEGFPSETRFVGWVTGVLYLVVGTSQVAGYLLFSWFGWLGLMAFLHAFRVAFPGAPPHLAATLVLLLPSVLYWPSSIGKDALMVLGLGVVTLGVARLVTPARPLLGLATFGAGAALVLQIRPHLLLVALVGVAASLAARPLPDRRAVAVAGTRVLLLVALVPLLAVGVGRLDAIFGAGASEIGSGGGPGVADVLDRTAARTTIGGSSFETSPVSSPLDLPVAVGNVLLRPFLFEATTLPSAVTALEGTVLVVLAAAGGRWLWRVGPAAASHPFVAYCAAYVLAFAFAFANIGNAGILARQRVQTLPVLMLLVAAARQHHRAHALTVDLASTGPATTDLASTAPTGTTPARLDPTPGPTLALPFASTPRMVPSP